MNLQEAHLFFPHELTDNLDDLWEERFFEHKQFFLTKIPLRKVFLARLAKLLKQFEAYTVICSMEFNLDKTLSYSVEQMNFNPVVIEAFNTYHKRRNKFKNEVLQSANPSELNQVITNWLNMEEDYRRWWNVDKSKDLTVEVLISKEPDPMEILAGLRIWDTNLPAQKTFDQLHKDYSFLPHVLQIEVKRLTLLLD